MPPLPLQEDLNLIKDRLAVKRMKRIVGINQKLAHPLFREQAHDILTQASVPPSIHLDAKGDEQYLVTRWIHVNKLYHLYQDENENHEPPTQQPLDLITAETAPDWK